MIVVSKLRNGVVYEENGVPYRVVDYKHKHLSRGSGTIKVKVRDLRTGNLVQKTYKSGERVEEIEIEKKKWQFLYRDSEGYYFMDNETYEQVEVEKKKVGDQGWYLKEGEEVGVLLWDGAFVDVEVPVSVVLGVTEAAPGEKGDSTSNVYKDAVLENGLKVRVPLFVKSGDKVKVDTRNGSYVERVS